MASLCEWRWCSCVRGETVNYPSGAHTLVCKTDIFGPGYYKGLERKLEAARVGHGAGYLEFPSCNVWLSRLVQSRPVVCRIWCLVDH